MFCYLIYVVLPNILQENTTTTAGYVLNSPWVHYLVPCWYKGIKYWYLLSLRVPARRGNSFARVPVWVGKLVSRSIAHALKINGRCCRLCLRLCLCLCLRLRLSLSRRRRSRSRKQARCCCFTHSLCAHTIVCVLLYFFQVNSKTADNQRNQTNLCKLQAWQLQRYNNNIKK